MSISSVPMVCSAWALGGYGVGGFKGSPRVGSNGCKEVPSRTPGRRGAMMGRLKGWKHMCSGAGLAIGMADLFEGAGGCRTDWTMWSERELEARC